jgi:hypothetical protein
MSETLIDFQIGEDYSNLRGGFKVEALNEFYRVINKKTMSIEHLIPKDREGEEVYKKNKQVAKVIDDILKLGKDFTFKTEVYGKYGYYEEEFTYNFTVYAEDHLSDELGYYKENECKDLKR